MTERAEFQERRLQRVELTEAVQVLDINQNEVLGTLVNIHEEGLLIAGTEAIQADHVYQVALQVPTKVCESQEILLGVDCLWIGEAENSRLQWSGCQIIDLSDKARQQLRQLVEILGR